jgi:beta-aspartyl-peptidase (threonine type)
MKLASLAAAVLAAGISMSHAATPVFILHTGAGLVHEGLTPERDAHMREVMKQAAEKSYGILKSGGSSLDAVSAAIVILEDEPEFNAGKGAVFNHDGKNELDASIMDGATLSAGAVANVHRVKNPILLARAVMEKSPHVMMVGDGAEEFAKSVGITLVDPKYFYTERRWQELQKALKEDEEKKKSTASKHGTVGAVALDAKGNLAAGTSTGGMTDKRFGRVGDSPVIGAGTYANAKCAVSATGWGEFYIRSVAAHDICARVGYANEPLQKAADDVVMGIVPKLGGDGGVIAIDTDGNIVAQYNTEGMGHAWVDKNGATHVSMFKDEK